MCFFKFFAKKKNKIPQETRTEEVESVKETAANVQTQTEPVFSEPFEQEVPQAIVNQPTVTEAEEKDLPTVDKRRYIIIKYDKSFTARLIQSEDGIKNYYSEIKNLILSYKGVKGRISWKKETFRKGRKALIKLRFRGKTLAVYLALQAGEYANTKYKVEDVSDNGQYEDTPCLYRIKNDRRLKYVKDLIAAVMSENGLIKSDSEDINYASEYHFETTEALIEKKLIKELFKEEAQSGTEFMTAELKKQISAGEVKLLMLDEVAATLVETSQAVSDSSVKGIINIDTLNEYFEDGERVTLDEIKKRVKGFNKKTTYIKVLARGTLGKKLTVEADSFSMDAVKMLTLTGGKALKKSGTK